MSLLFTLHDRTCSPFKCVPPSVWPLGKWPQWNSYTLGILRSFSENLHVSEFVWRGYCETWQSFAVREWNDLVFTPSGKKNMLFRFSRMCISGSGSEEVLMYSRYTFCYPDWFELSSGINFLSNSSNCSSQSSSCSFCVCSKKFWCSDTLLAV